MNNKQIPILSIAGKSGAGKTTILEKIIPELKRFGLRVGTIKHHHRGEFDLDTPGKDSFRHKQAGAEKSVISSPRRIGIVMDADHDHRPEELAPLLSGVDIILLEGYKAQELPKIEIFRKEAHERPLCLDDKNLIAMITDDVIELDVPRFGLKDIKGVGDFIIRHFKITPGAGSF